MARRSRVLAEVLLVLVLISFHPWFAEPDQITVSENGDLRDEKRTDGAPHTDRDITSLSPIRLVESIDDIERIFTSTEGNSSAVMLLLVFNEDCKHCPDMMDMMEEAWWKVTEMASENPAYEEFRTPIFAKIEESLVTHIFKVEIVPTLVFAVSSVPDASSDPFIHIQDYAGRSQTSAEIFHTVMRAWYFNVVAAGGVKMVDETHARIEPKAFVNARDCFSFFELHAQYYQQLISTKPLLPPTLTNEEAMYAEWLLEDPEGEDIVVLMQCRIQKDDGDSDEIDALYAAYSEVTETSFSLRDRIFFSVTDCQVDGSVVAFFIPKNTEIEKGWSDQLGHISFVPSEDRSVATLKEFLVQVLTPSTLWFDRQSTAPIAFPVYRQLHATLFLDFHNLPDTTRPMADSALLQRDAVVQFRRACRNQKRFNTHSELDMVCLIVPSIEHRVLSTFGVDLWSPLDDEASNFTGWDGKALPLLLVTDGRDTNGLKRYAMTPDEFTTMGVLEFYNRFWLGDLRPFMKSSSQSDAIAHNEAGVVLLTGSTADAFIRKNHAGQQHSLVLFESSVCSHCKRVSVVWDELSSLLQHVGWNSLVSISKLNVDNEDIPLSWNLDVEWVPEVYYCPPERAETGDLLHWKAFGWKDVVGDGVGRISSPVQILEWMIQEGDFSNETLQNLLEDMEV